MNDMEDYKFNRATLLIVILHVTTTCSNIVFISSMHCLHDIQYMSMDSGACDLNQALIGWRVINLTRSKIPSYARCSPPPPHPVRETIDWYITPVSSVICAQLVLVMF